MRSLLILLTVLISIGASSQTVTRIDVSCGWAGENSEEVIAYRGFLNTGKYERVKKNLINGCNVEKVLSAIALLELSDSLKIFLTDKQKQALTDITQSSDLYELCYTCTHRESGTLKELFLKKNIGYFIISSGIFTKSSVRE
jgi:hypothetical protein